MKEEYPLYYITGTKFKGDKTMFMFLALGIIVNKTMYISVASYESIVKIKGADNEGYVCLN